LELGNDSQFQTWQKVPLEKEMGNLIVSTLNRSSHDRYTIVQEPELANTQRPDIWAQSLSVTSPVPIELKLLENWTGPRLCERLRNQLVGDYLREPSARFGVMILVWRGLRKTRGWKINGSVVKLSELASAIKLYWDSIAVNYPDVDDIAVIVIDLTMRSQVSDS
jgi:hypothetical protein